MLILSGFSTICGILQNLNPILGQPVKKRPCITQYLKEVFHELARQKGSEILSGHLAKDHVHMCISIPPKYAVSEVIGYLKGKSAIAVSRVCEIITFTTLS